MTTAGFSGASPACPSSTAMAKHSQTHGSFAERAIMHPGAAQQSHKTLRDVPEDGPCNTSTSLGLNFGLVPLLPLSVGPEPGTLIAAWLGGQELQLQTQQSTELHCSGADAQHPEVSTTECALCSGHSPHPAPLLAQSTRQNKGEGSGCKTEAALQSTMYEDASATGRFNS